MAPEIVRVFDPDTNTVRAIPASELVPGMLRARIVDRDGPTLHDNVWVKAGRAHMRDYQHPPFGEELRGVMRQLSETFAGCYDCTPEEWEDGFRRDSHPDREIALWLRAAVVMNRFATGDFGRPQRRRNVFGVLVACLNCGGDRRFVRSTAGDTPALSPKDFDDIVEAFFAGPEGAEEDEADAEP
jgi:hypothetical protein